MVGERSLQQCQGDIRGKFNGDGHILMLNNLLRIDIEGRTEGKNEMLLDWMTTDGEWTPKEEVHRPTVELRCAT